MGLSLVVGMLADLKDEDEEGFAEYRQQFERVNEVLTEAGLPKHEEPADCETWSADMIAYSGLHYLRRIAAHLAYGLPRPEPGDDARLIDSVVKRYHRDCGPPGVLDRLLARRRKRPAAFTHLIDHSDAEGYYVPVDFEEVLVPGGARDVAGGQIGSVQRLLAECERLRDVLEIPASLRFEDDMSEILGEQGQGNMVWQRYAIETYTCLCLIEASRASLKSGAAIVFT